jgi:hypothetical protein
MNGVGREYPVIPSLHTEFSSKISFVPNLIFLQWVCITAFTLQNYINIEKMISFKLT